MSSNWQADVVEWSKLLGVICNDKPVLLERSDKTLKKRLLFEEFAELEKAIQDDDLVSIADGAADLIYIILGVTAAYGIDMIPIWDEVHRTNMLKAGGPVREDGKILKPKGWRRPNIAGLIRSQSNR